MLTAFPSSSPHAFLPVTPSPLSPRRQKSNGSFAFMSSTPQPESKQSTPRVPFSSRPIKTAAAAQKPDALSQRRRDIFLKQVRERREDRRWDARGEDIMRLDFVRRQRRWEAEQALAAPPQLSDPPEEEDDDEAELPVYSSQMQPFASSSQAPQPDEEVDAVLQQEDEELDALVALMESEDGKQEVPTEGFGSDDEDYDSIFREFVREDAGSDLQQQQQQGDEMDMS